MNKFSVLFIAIILTFYSLRSNQDNELLMRDISILMDNSESINSVLNLEAVKTYSSPLAVTDMISEMLYYESCPILVTQSVLKNFLELAEITEKLLELDPVKYTNNIHNFNTSEQYKNTILQDVSYVFNLSNMLKKIKNNYDNFEPKLEDSPKEAKERLNNILTIIKHPNNFHAPIQVIANILFKYYLVLQKLKASGPNIYRINAFLVLIIPKTYLQKTKENALNPEDDELNLGLKLKELQDIYEPLKSTSYSSLIHNAYFYRNYIGDPKKFIATLHEIFFTKRYPMPVGNTDLNKIYPEYLWNIYLAGHGSDPDRPFPQIAGIPKATFRHVLEFFNSQINTNLAFVISCYSGSDEHLKSITEYNLKYILALGALTHSVSSRFTTYEFSLNNQNRLELLYSTNVSKFFQSLRTTAGDSYYNIFNYIQLFWKINSKSNHKFYRYNIPLLKLPNTDWFQIVDLQKNEFNLNKLLIELHGYNQKPIIINNKRLLFLNSKYQYEQHLSKPVTHTLSNKKQEVNINFPIIIQGKIAPLVIPMQSKNTKFTFESIEAKDCPLSYLAIKFMGLPTQFYNRTFNIKSLTIRNPNISIERGTILDLGLFNIWNAKSGNGEQPTILPSGETVLVNNVTIKVRTTGPKPIFRLKFEYNNQKYVFSESIHQDIKSFLRPAKIVGDGSGAAKLNKEVTVSPLKPTSKHKSKTNISDKNFKNIEIAIQKKLELIELQKVRSQRFALQALSQTLNSLSSS